MEECTQKMNILPFVMDRCGDYVGAIIPHILNLLRQGLGQRVDLLAHELEQERRVSILFVSMRFSFDTTFRYYINMCDAIMLHLLLLSE